MEGCARTISKTTGIVRIPPIPPTIGTNFLHKLGQTNFRKVQHFCSDGDVRMLSEQKLPPSNQASLIQTPLYAQGEVVLLPSWMAFDKETLVFDAFFKETLQEFPNSSYLPRYVKIYFFLEDGTVQIVEPKSENSGLQQGVFLKRQRVPLPSSGRTDEFLDVSDLNVGQEVEIFGRVFKITNCDRFTRNFLNRNGISVADPVESPEDPYLKYRKSLQTHFPKKPKLSSEDIRQFLKYDRCVLRFYGYWDDRHNLNGDLHRLCIQYYLADDSIEVRVLANKAEDKAGFTLLSRQRLPMDVATVPSPGEFDDNSVLNILSEDCGGARLLLDPLRCGVEPKRFYLASDLAIGGVVNVMGRKVVLCACDKYTQEFYRKNYGVVSFDPVPYPDDGETGEVKYTNPPPPYNGFGTYEDSLRNCVSVTPKAVYTRDLKQKLEQSRNGYDGHILRFGARMITKNNRTAHRRFVISYFLVDDTISVFENFNHLGLEGPSGQTFFSRSYFVKPGEDKYGSKTPAMYTKEDLFVGATLILNEFTFHLVEADEYSLRYMELNTSKFVKSNSLIIMEKIRQCAKLNREFISGNFASSLECGVIPFCKFRKALIDLMGEGLVEQEIITVARKHRIKIETEIDKWTVRHKIQCHFKKSMYVVDRSNLFIYLQQCDPDNTGRVPKNVLMRCLKGSHIPLPETYMEEMLECMKPAEDGNIPYNDVLDFMDFFSPVPCPVYSERSWMSKEEDRNIIIDVNSFLRELGLEGGESGKNECLP